MTEFGMFFILLFTCVGMWLTMIDYWFDYKPMVEELWARRILGDEIYERNAKPKPTPEVKKPIMNLGKPVYDPPFIWPLIEITTGGSKVLRHGVKGAPLASRLNATVTVTNAAQNFVPVSQKEDLADDRPPWED